MCFIYQAFISSDDWSIGVGVEVSVVVGARVVLGQRFFDLKHIFTYTHRDSVIETKIHGAFWNGNSPLNEMELIS